MIDKVPVPDSQQEIVIALSQLYQSAFGNLLVLVSLILAFAGVILPIGIALMQSRQQRKESEQAREKIEYEVKVAVQNVRAELLENQAKSLLAFQERSDKIVADLRQEIEKQFAGVRAHTFHVEAITAQNEGVHVVAVRSACFAIVKYLAAGDYKNVRKTCTYIAIENLKELDEKSFEENPRLRVHCDRAVEALKGMDDDGKFADLIEDFEKELQLSAKRKRTEEDEEGSEEDNGDAVH